MNRPTPLRFYICYLFAILCVSLVSASVSLGAERQTEVLEWPEGLPVYDHIVIVMEENKDYSEVIGNPAAPYINEVLKKEGASFTRMFGEEHYSQGNYFWLFSGDNQTVGFDDEIPNAENNPNYPFTTPNLGSQLISKGLSFKGYAESLPVIGFTGDSQGLYARKHVPWISFANVPNGETVETSSNLRFADFPEDFNQLPTVCFVIPNLDNDMHNGPDEESIPAGDRWLKENIESYYQWAKEHNSLLILAFDENDDKRAYLGLTNPIVDPEKCKDYNREVLHRPAKLDRHHLCRCPHQAGRLRRGQRHHACERASHNRGDVWIVESGQATAQRRGDGNLRRLLDHRRFPDSEIAAKLRAMRDVIP